MRFRFLAIPALLGGLMLSGPTTHVTAQDTAPAPATSYTDDQLESFAAAAVKVDEIGRRWIEQIEAAPDDAQAAQLRDQANEEMVQAVESEGLTARQYNEIFIAAREDPELRERIAQLVQQVD